MKLFNHPKEFTLYNLLLLVKLNKIFVVITIFAFTVVLIVISFIVPQHYVASCSLLPPKKDGGSAGLSSFIQNFTGGGLNFGSMGQSDQSKVFGEIIKSRTVAEYIIEKIQLKKNKSFTGISNENLVGYIVGSLIVDVDKSGLIYVSSDVATGYFPSASEGKQASKFAAELANSAVEGLDMVIRNRSMSSAKQSKEYVEKEIESYLTKLDSIETRLEEFQKSNKVLAIDEQTQAIVTQAIEVGSQLAKADLEKNLALLEYQPNSPQYQFYNRQRELLGEQYRKIQSGGLTKDESFSIPLDDVPKLIKEYTTLFRERKIIEQVLLYLETQRHQEAIQEKRDLPVVEVLDKAYPPEEKYSPKRSLMVLLGVILSLIFSIIYISFKAFQSGTIYLEESKS